MQFVPASLDIRKPSSNDDPNTCPDLHQGQRRYFRRVRGGKRGDMGLACQTLVVRSYQQLSIYREFSAFNRK